MKNFILRKVFLYFTIVLVVPCFANATSINTNGDIFFGNSWGQYFGVNGTGVDKIEAFIINDIGSENVDFELGAGLGCSDGDGLGCFSEVGLNGSIINPNYSLATGPANTTSPFTWAALFTGNPANQLFDVDFLIYGQGVLGLTGRFNWNGTAFNQTAYESTDYDRTPIPEPATMLLLGTGLVGVAGAARRKKKNQA